MITVEWQLPWGSAGMAAGMTHARLRSKLNRLGKQHGFEIGLYTTDDRYRVRADLTEQQYTILCLQWSNEQEYRWKTVSRFTL